MVFLSVLIVFLFFCIFVFLLTFFVAAPPHPSHLPPTRGSRGPPGGLLEGSEGAKGGVPRWLPGGLLGGFSFDSFGRIHPLHEQV